MAFRGRGAARDYAAPGRSYSAAGGRDTRDSGGGGRYQPYGSRDGRGGGSVQGRGEALARQQREQGRPGARDIRGGGTTSGGRDWERRDSDRRPPPRDAERKRPRDPTPPRGGGGGGRGGDSRPTFQKPSRPDGAPASTLFQDIMSLMPFSQRDRAVVEQRARNPYRRGLPASLVAVTSHADSIPARGVGALTQKVSLQLRGLEPVTQPLDEGETQGAALAAALRAPGDGEVCARVLLVTGGGFLAGGTTERVSREHCLRRVSLVCAQRVQGGRPDERNPFCYGGCVPAGDKAAMVDDVVQLVRQQTGLDLAQVSTWHRVCDARYHDSDDIRSRTVYFLPELSELGEGAEVAPYAHETTEEYEETEEEEEEIEEDVETEVEDEDAAEEEPAAAEGAEGEEEGEKKPKEKKMKKITKTVTKTVKKKVKVTKTRTKLVRQLEPTPITFSTLVQGPAGNNERTADMLVAFDILDELFKREMGAQIVSYLGTKKQGDAKHKEEAEREKETEDAFRKQLQDLRDQQRADTQAKEAELKEGWEAEDDGKTDDEIAEEKEARDKVRKAAVQEIVDKYSAMRRDEEEKRKVVRLKVVDATDSAAFHGFQWFDRVRGGRDVSCTGSVPRQLLLQVLLCLDTDLPEWEAWETLEPCGPGQVVRYPECCRLKSLELAYTPPPQQPEAEASAVAADGAAGDGAAEGGGDAMEDDGDIC